MLGHGTRVLVLAIAMLVGCKHPFDPLEARDLRASAVAIGAPAPDATVVLPSGTSIALSELLRGNAKTVVVFYRGFY